MLGDVTKKTEKTNQIIDGSLNIKVLAFKRRNSIFVLIHKKNIINFIPIKSYYHTNNNEK
jgi:hypothetical protein